MWDFFKKFKWLMPWKGRKERIWVVWDWKWKVVRTSRKWADKWIPKNVKPKVDMILWWDNKSLSETTFKEGKAYTDLLEQFWVTGNDSVSKNTKDERAFARAKIEDVLINRWDMVTVKTMSVWKEDTEDNLVDFSWCWMQILSQDLTRNLEENIKVSCTIWNLRLNTRWKIVRIIEHKDKRLTGYWIEFLGINKDQEIELDEIVWGCKNVNRKKRSDIKSIGLSMEWSDETGNDKFPWLADLYKWAKYKSELWIIKDNKVKELISSEIIKIGEKWITLVSKGVGLLEWDKVGMKLILWNQRFKIKWKIISSTQNRTKTPISSTSEIEFEVIINELNKHLSIRDALEYLREKRNKRYNTEQFSDTNIYVKTWKRRCKLLDISVWWIWILSKDSNNNVLDIISLDFNIWRVSFSSLGWEIKSKKIMDDGTCKYWIQFVNLTREQQKELNQLNWAFTNIK